MATALSRNRILASAVALADRDGLDAASLRKVAGELGVHVTSLYHHVATKEALLDGIVEELFAGAGLPQGELTWERWVRGFTAAVHRLAVEHPGAFAVLLRRPVQGAVATATFESGLAAFTREGLSPGEAYASIKAVTLGILGCCMEQAYGAGGGTMSTDVSALPSREFPVLHALTESDAEVDVVEVLTEVLVAGLARRVATARRL